MGQFLTSSSEFANLYNFLFKTNIIKLYFEMRLIIYMDIILTYNCNIEGQWE